MDSERPAVAQPLDGTDPHLLADGTRPDAAALPAGADRRARLIAGLTWNVVYSAFEVIFSLGAMLLLVRIIPPRDYGRAAVVVGVLGTLNVFNAHVFVEAALQLPEGETPDWSLHWTFAFYLQVALALVCHLIAALCWMSPAYVPIAKLLHLAAFGVLFESGNALGGTMLRRELDFRRMKMVAGCGMCVRLIATVAAGLLGGGAYAIILGGNVIASLPFGVDLFLIRRWRPDSGWWRHFERRRYADAFRFGLQRTVGGIVSGVRDGIEAAILPGTIGFAGIGLVNRAQALYGTTVGRIGTVLADTVYPFLPREKKNPERYASQATLYLQVVSFIAVPGALFVGRHGPLLSRVLYGSKWAAADQLIWPAALIGLGLTFFSIAAEILIASGALRKALALDMIAAASVLPALAAAWMTHLTLPYAWTVAGVQLSVALVALTSVSPLLQRGWWRITLGPALVAALAGLGAGWLLPPIGQRPAIQVAVQAFVFLAVGALSLRIFFGVVVERLVLRLSAGPLVRRVLLFPRRDTRSDPDPVAVSLRASSPVVHGRERPSEP